MFTTFTSLFIFLINPLSERPDVYKSQLIANSLMYKYILNFLHTCYKLNSSRCSEQMSYHRLC